MDSQARPHTGGACFILYIPKKELYRATLKSWDTKISHFDHLGGPFQKNHFKAIFPTAYLSTQKVSSKYYSSYLNDISCKLEYFSPKVTQKGIHIKRLSIKIVQLIAKPFHMERSLSAIKFLFNLAERQLRNHQICATDLK